MERSLCLEEGLLIKAGTDCVGSGCFWSQVSSWLFSHWHTGLVRFLGFILFPSVPLSPWQSTVALNRRYMTWENKWWTAAWALGPGPSEQVRRGLCMSGKSHFWARGLVLHEGSSVPTQPFLFNQWGRECVLPVLQQNYAVYAQVVYFMVSVSLFCELASSSLLMNDSVWETFSLL